MMWVIVINAIAVAINIIVLYLNVSTLHRRVSRLEWIRDPGRAAAGTWTTETTITEEVEPEK